MSCFVSGAALGALIATVIVLFGVGILLMMIILKYPTWSSEEDRKRFEARK